MPSLELQIANALGSLVVKLNRRIKQSLTSQKTPIINLTQLRILMIIRKKESSSANEIAELLDITPASMTVNIKYLQEKKFLDREIDQNDKRHQNLLITKKGESKLKEVGLLIFEEVSENMQGADSKQKKELQSAIELLSSFLN